ncbi:hypothetical protein CH298_04240 [Rhodococcoides fascians]|uniref:HNH endonuclease n=1 Tax=Rhodococcoides fascians TaxID=1828 RepID=UPI000B9AAFA5|nr:HNH endonuclease signature motif containing protein [Rhodococcus fascians]OZE92715.1 hypothetical protein CH303_04235 [Rhodococcus fascians]OZF23348.1 hypothetical protein CH298_04240 [Rhodococcus fascians]OZF25061.1 hypothetical protein CH297_04235 [Rhodococcus fascians]OZF72657.1 hypothetical protein CH308_04240 [Rhodococcus fascians]OZF73956.1 hypothetical protein CH307_04240 [Rhodococcus fascians]
MASEKRKEIPADVRERVAARSGYVCVKCGSDDRCEVDHIIPWTITQDDSEDNLQLLCFPCNRRKGSKVEAGRKTWFHPEFFGAVSGSVGLG